MSQRVSIIIGAFLCLTMCGCGQLASSPKIGLIPEENSRLDLQGNRDLGLVYVDKGKKFKNSVLFVSKVSTNRVLPKKGVIPEEMAVYLKSSLIEHLKDSKMFSNVTDDRYVIDGNNEKNVLLLESTISELDPGNRWLRWLATITGVGRAKIQVETKIKDAKTNEVIFVASNRRVGIMGAFGGSSKAFIHNSLDEISRAHQRYFNRKSNGE